MWSQQRRCGFRLLTLTLSVCECVCLFASVLHLLSSTSRPSFVNQRSAILCLHRVYRRRTLLFLCPFRFWMFPIKLRTKSDVYPTSSFCKLCTQSSAFTCIIYKPYLFTDCSCPLLWKQSCMHEFKSNNEVWVRFKILLFFLTYRFLLSFKLTQNWVKSIFTYPSPACIFISHSWLHVTLQFQPIYFTLGGEEGEGGLFAALFSDPSKRLLLSKCEKSFSTCALLLFPASSSRPPPQLLFAGFPPSPPVSSHSVFLLFVSDSETTEDETTEPQMETKEGPGRHHDKAGRKGPSGILFKLLFFLLFF